MHPRWTAAEKRVLDQFARAVASGRFPTARGAGRACQEALNRLHRRYPKRYGDIHERTLVSLQGELWPRVAKLRFRWFNSRWSKEKTALIDRYARRTLAHEFPTMSEAAGACCVAINRLLARLEQNRTGRRRWVAVRVPAAVYDKIFDRTRVLGPNMLPHRQWSKTEGKVLARWAREYERRLGTNRRMSLDTVASLMKVELGRLGYYRTAGACITAVVDWRHGRLRAGARQ